MVHDEDWAVAQDLLVARIVFGTPCSLRTWRWKKRLKAHVCRQTNDLAPRMHNLIRLAEIGDVRPSQDYEDVLAEMNAFNLEGRYPDMLMPPPSPAEARDYLTRAEEVLQWLLSQLEPLSKTIYALYRPTVCLCGSGSYLALRRRARQTSGATSICWWCRRNLMGRADVGMSICCGGWRRAPTAGSSQFRAGSVSGKKIPRAPLWKSRVVTASK